MKNNFKRLILAALVIVSYGTIIEAKTANAQLHETHKEIEKFHNGFDLILLKGDKQGYAILAQIQAIPLNDDESPVGKKLNVLIKELNAIFKTVHNIVKKYHGKGKGILTNFLFEMSRSCNLEELFKKTIAELEEINNIHESVNEEKTYQETMKLFIDFLKRIQPIWHDALLKKDLIIKNLRDSL
jgi:hypothetical protein